MGDDGNLGGRSIVGDAVVDVNYSATGPFFGD